MKKHLLTSAIVLAGSSLFAAQYMHVNLPNGKCYDTKIEKTDRICHIKGDSINQIKLVRKDSSFALYPANGAEVTFDDEITRVKGDTSIWYNRDNKPQYVHFFGKENVYQAKANNKALQILGKIVENSKKKEKNFIISPISLQIGLAMMANGASNDATYNSITNLLGCPGMQVDSLNEWYNRKITYMLSESPNNRKISTANGIWLKNGCPFSKNYIQNLTDYYKATVSNVDFMQDSTYNKMDRWVAETTDSMIQSIGLDTDEVSKSLRACVLANTVSFQSNWAEPYFETRKDSFTTIDGKKVEVEMMSGYGDDAGDHYYYGETEDYIVAKKQLSQSYREEEWESNSAYEMVFILPKEGKTPMDILPTIDLDKLPQTERIKDTLDIVYLDIPSFSIDDNNELKETLESLGLESIFITGNLENIAPSIYVSDSYQKTHLEVGEDGVKGAALTVFDNVITGEGPYYPTTIRHNVILNRPFILILKNQVHDYDVSGNNDIIFLGIINDPTQK